MATVASTRQITRISRHLLVSTRPNPVAPTPLFKLPRRQLTLSTTIMNRNNRSIDQPSTRINSLNLNLEAPPTVPESGDSIKSIDQVMRDIQREAELKAAHANAQYSHLSDPAVDASKEQQQSGSESESQQDQQYQHSTSSESLYADANANANDSSSGAGGVPPPQPPKKPSRFWIYMYHILYWSALGSIPVHLLMTKGEAKDLKALQEWKISVLTDMRDKLRRGESVEEEEALLTVGHDRSKREEQVDEKYFEDLLQSAEKMDFIFGKDKEAAIAVPTPAPILASAPAAPVVPRKPASPKSEKSYFPQQQQQQHDHLSAAAIVVRPPEYHSNNNIQSQAAAMVFIRDDAAPYAEFLRNNHDNTFGITVQTFYTTLFLFKSANQAKSTLRFALRMLAEEGLTWAQKFRKELQSLKN
ncbi:hypothetical protein BGW39_009102, partial [Mortierella sp. 14UC]